MEAGRPNGRMDEEQIYSHGKLEEQLTVSPDISTPKQSLLFNCTSTVSIEGESRWRHLEPVMQGLWLMA